MADNETTGTGKAVATDKVTYSGDADQNVQLVKVVQTTGAEGSKTVVDPAHDDPDAGNPFKVGGKASSTSPTDVASGDRVNAWFTLNGRQTVSIRDGSGNEPTTTNWSSTTFTSGNVTALAISAQMYTSDGTNSVLFRQRTATATLANVSGSASSVTVLASNTSRIGATIVNDSTVSLYVKFGSTASTTSYTYLLTPGQTLELAQPVYTGIITGIWASATGSARTTELT